MPKVHSIYLLSFSEFKCAQIFLYTGNLWVEISKATPVSSLRYDQKKSNILAFEDVNYKISQITFFHMITDQSISCCYECETRCLLTMVSCFSNELIKNSEETDRVHFSGWKYTSLQETKEYKNKAFNWGKKSILQSFILLNSRNHNSINKILQDN